MGKPYQDAASQIQRRRLRNFALSLHSVIFAIVMIVGLIFLRYRGPNDPSVLFPPAIWGFVLIGHWLWTAQANDSDQSMERMWESVFGEARDGALSERKPLEDAKDMPRDARIRQAVEIELAREKVKRRRMLFRANVAVYLAFVVLAWIVIPIIYGPFLTVSSSTSVVALTLGGLFEVLLHYAAVRPDTNKGERAMRERLLGRALMNLAAEEDALPEKPKRQHQHLRLQDDGELVEVDDDLDAEDFTGADEHQQAAGHTVS